MLTYHFTQTALCLGHEGKFIYIPLLALGEAINNAQMKNLRRTLKKPQGESKSAQSPLGEAIP